MRKVGDRAKPQRLEQGWPGAVEAGRMDGSCAVTGLRRGGTEASMYVGGGGVPSPGPGPGHWVSRPAGQPQSRGHKSMPCNQIGWDSPSDPCADTHR